MNASGAIVFQNFWLLTEHAHHASKPPAEARYMVDELWGSGFSSFNRRLQ
jgi:hypothetical protein